MYSQILEYLFCGSLADAKKFNEDHPNSNIICVLPKRPASEPTQAIHIPIISEDGKVHPRLIKRANAIIQALAQIGDRVLVHCDSGDKLSPFIIAEYLRRNNGFSAEQAYEYVKTHRKETAEKSQWPKVDE